MADFLLAPTGWVLAALALALQREPRGLHRDERGLLVRLWQSARVPSCCWAGRHVISWNYIAFGICGESTCCQPS